PGLVVNRDRLTLAGYVAAHIRRVIGPGNSIAIGTGLGADYVRIVTDGHRPAASIAGRHGSVIGCRHAAGATDRRVRREGANHRPGLVVNRDRLALAGHVAAHIRRVIGAGRGIAIGTGLGAAHVRIVRDGDGA